MPRTQGQALAFLAGLLVLAFTPGPSAAQYSEARIVSEHVRVRVSVEREWFGRETVQDLERCWQFVHRVTDGGLPRRISVTIDWSASAVRSNPEDGTLFIGMNHPAAARDPKVFLLHRTTREMARLGLIALSRGAAARPENEFLLAGMSEILAHEFDHTTRVLGGAWAISHLLDRIQPLSLSDGGRQLGDSPYLHGFHSSSPGITFLLTCRELFGREKLMKFFESLRKSTFEDAAASSFKTPVRRIEETWLKRVREYQVTDFQAAAAEDAPVLLRVAFAPERAVAGGTVRVLFLVGDRAGDVLPEGVFLVEGTRVFRAQAQSVNGGKGFAAEIPVDRTRPPGTHEFQIIVVDEAGNIGIWTRSYQVQ